MSVRLRFTLTILVCLIVTSSAQALVPLQTPLAPAEGLATGSTTPAGFSARDFFTTQIAPVNTRNVDWTRGTIGDSNRIGGGSLHPALVKASEDFLAGRPIVINADTPENEKESISGMQGRTLWYGALVGERFMPNGDLAVEICWVDLYTGTPAPTRLITHGVSISCATNWAVGGVGSGLGQATDANGNPVVAGLDARAAYINGSQGYYRPVAAEGSYYRQGELQTENIYGYIDMDIVDGARAGGFWYGLYGGGYQYSWKCDRGLFPDILCEVVTNPFAFVPDRSYQCLTGTVCDTVNGAQRDINQALAQAPATIQAELTKVQKTIFDTAAAAGAAVTSTVQGVTSTVDAATVDLEPPTISEMSGPLYVNRNRADDHRHEGLYSATEALHIEAKDGPATSPKAGVARVDLLVDGQVHQTNAGSCAATTCLPYVGDLALRADEVSDGPHNVAVVVVDQSGNRTRREWSVTVDRRGDVIHARPFQADELASPLHQEWLRTDGFDARREEDGLVETRSKAACAVNALGCGITRRRVAGDEDGVFVYSTMTGVSTDDPRLSPVASAVRVRTADLGTLIGSSNPDEIAEPWQTLPPGRGDAVDRYDLVEAGQDEGAQPRTHTTSTWVDRATRLPIRQRTEEADGTVTSDVRYTYGVDRLADAQAPPQLFAVAQASSDLQGRQTQLGPLAYPQAASPSVARETSILEGQQFRRSFGLPDSYSIVAAAVDDPDLGTTLARYGVKLTPAEEAVVEQQNQVAEQTAISDAYVARTPAALAAYAGTQITENGKLRMSFTSDPTPFVNAVKALVPIPASIEGRQVEFTLTALEAKYETVKSDREALRTLGIDVVAVSIDDWRNRIEVAVREPATSQQDTLTSRYGPAVVLVAGQPAVTTEAVAGRINAVSPPYRGGMAIFNDDNNLSTCSAGFSVHRGKRFRVLTAGHCAQLGDQWMRAPNLRFQSMGVTRARHRGPYGDFATIQVAKSETTFRVLNRTHVKPTQYQTIRSVARRTSGVEDSNAHPGTFLCQSGAMREWPRCGRLLDRSVSQRACPDASGDSGCVVSDNQMKSSGSSIGGDSGAPVYSGDVAWGIHYAGDDEGFLFTPAQTIEEVYSVLFITESHRG